ncbi:MAG: helix-turn-helix transcriptional regulator [Aggregatilineales bacterium]
MVAKRELSLSQKLSLLMEEGQPTNGKLISSPADIARFTGMSHQTLMNLLQGQSTNPRLDTLRGLCDLYGISLDYFDCASADQCRAHLLQQATTRNASVLREIMTRTEMLTADGKKRVLRLMEWMQLGIRAQSAQQQRKSH